MADSQKVFRSGPYGAKYMPGEAKEAIYYAAKRAGKQQGEWLAEAAAEKIARERQADDLSATTMEVIPPGSTDITTAMIPPGRELSIAELDIAARLAEHLATVRGQNLAPKARNVSARTIAGVQRILAKRIIGA